MQVPAAKNLQGMCCVLSAIWLLLLENQEVKKRTIKGQRKESEEVQRTSCWVWVRIELALSTLCELQESEEVQRTSLSLFHVVRIAGK